MQSAADDKIDGCPRSCRLPRHESANAVERFEARATALLQMPVKVWIAEGVLAERGRRCALRRHEGVNIGDERGYLRMQLHNRKL